MKKTLRIIGIGGAIASAAAIIIGAFIVKSATMEDIGIVGFILSPLVKGLGDK